MELELTRINHLGGSLRLRRELLVSSLEGVQISFYNDVLSRLVSFFFFSSDKTGNRCMTALANDM